MMYLLLRDNKQSGPYSFEELKAKGLKAYDLVWVEGRSAAWRYPSEIGELVAFAPVVEEQPFDRFFKKPGATQTSTSAAVATQPAVSNMTTIKRTIYVTMPGGAAREVTRDMPIRETALVREPAPKLETLLSRDQPQVRDLPPVRERVDYAAARAEYRREPVAEILTPLPKRKSNRVGQLALVAVAVVVVLAAGIFIGLSIQKGSKRFDTLAVNAPVNAKQTRSTAQQLPVTTPVNNNASTSLPATSAVPATPIGLAAENAATPGGGTGAALTGQRNPGTQPSDKSAASLTNPPVNKPHHSNRKTDASRIPAPAPAAMDSMVAQPSVVHREAVHRTDASQGQAEDKEGLKAALANQVSVGTNKFEVGTFGGIHNLQVTVTNRSAYALDMVVVEVDYIQANKKTYKSENLYFRGIGPGSALMLEAPKTSRGINIQYKITSINSKQLGLSEPGT